VPMSGIPDMTPTSLVASLAGKIIKNGRVFERGENCYKMVYYTLHLTYAKSEIMF